ncbi:hypothetical protein BDC45DRAFT_542580 [Circinella umbellata]|nr:hypothetical protein BDC45DRAFT_542580 [Circinella umbellata]
MNIKSNEVKEDKEEENKTKEASIVKEENIKKIGKNHEKDVKKTKKGEKPNLKRKPENDLDDLWPNYIKVKQTMLSYLNANYEFYQDILCSGRDNIMNHLINRLEFGITPETAYHTSCSSDYWFDALRDSQIATVTYTTSIAVFMNNIHWKSVLHLSFTIPSDTN